MTNKIKKTAKISIADYLRAIKKADREIQLTQSVGWKRITDIHQSKKRYNRKANKTAAKEE